MAEDRITDSNFSNIRAITPLLLRNPDTTICSYNVTTHGHIYSVYVS